MSFANIMKFIAHVEDNYPVASWTVGNLHVWPLIRVYLAYNFIVNTTVKPVNTTGITNSSMQTESYAGQGLIRNENLLERRADAVFLSLTDTARVKVGNVLHDSLCDHLLQLLENKGINSLYMGLSLKYDLERVTNSQIVDIRRYIYSIMGSINPMNELISDLYGLDGFNKELAHFLQVNDVEIPLYDIGRVKQLAIEIRNAADFFNLVFRKVRPALGFVTCYYDPIGMAFNLACRENGIVSFDIQHGHQTNNHFAYADWNNVPNRGYELLPNYFWCWGKKEADIINKWSGSAQSFHKPIMGGNPWHEAVKGYIAKDFSDKVEELNSLCSGKLNVLFTHQASYGLEDWIIDAIERSPDSWFWWIRLHPRTDEHEKSMIIDRLNKCRNRNMEVNISTEIPLPILLNCMDVHVTGFSSCITEASFYDIFSVVTHSCGLEHYPGEIEGGIVLTAFNKEDLINAIMLQYSRHNGKGSAGGNNSNLLKSAVDEIVGMVQNIKHNQSSAGSTVLGKDNTGNPTLLYNYLYMVFSEKMYNSIIDNYKDNEALPSLYFVAKAYKSIKNENAASLYFERVIQKLTGADNNIENCISAMQLSGIYTEVTGMVIHGEINTDQSKLNESILDLCHRNEIFRELYLNKLFQASYYNQIIAFTDYNKPDTDYFAGRAYKGLLMYENSKIYLCKYITAFEDMGINKDLIVSNKDFVISAYFHMGEICYLQNSITDACNWFTKCKMLSETIHIKAEEYLKKISTGKSQ